MAPSERESAPALENWIAEWEAHGGSSPESNSGTTPGNSRRNTDRWIKAQEHAANYDQALKAWQADDTLACRRMLHGVLAKNPQHRDSLLLLAQLEILERQPQVIQAPLAQFCNQNPQDPSAQHMLGLVCESLGKKQAALARYQTAVKLAPDNLAYQASVDGILNPEQPLLLPDGESTQERSNGDLWTGT
ncbi:MAG: hypothetical protein MPJ50_15295, partial [Pirellulales bacterium]|nr:hypothetical protein [Pirellulales bacterium]